MPKTCAWPRVGRASVAEEPSPRPIPVRPDTSENAPLAVLVPEPVPRPGIKPPGRGTATGPEPETTLETSIFSRIGGTINDPANVGSQKLQVYSNGVLKIHKTLFSLTKRMGGRVVVAAWDTRGVVFANCC